MASNQVTSRETAAAYRGAGWWTTDTLAGRVRRHASAHPGQIAVVDGTGRHTYGDLQGDAVRLAGALRGAGVRPGEVVSVQLPNRYETVVVAVAAQSAGAVINPLLPNYRAHELTHVFRTARPAAVFTPSVYRDWDYRPMVDEVERAAGVSPVHFTLEDVEAILAGRAGRAGRSAPDGRADPDGWADPDGRADPAAGAVSEIIFTSGTESTPKAVMHTEETTNFAVRTAYEDLGVAPGASVWMPSPVGHSTGFNYGIRAALYHGGTLVLQDRWDPSAAVEMITNRGCSYTLAATTFLADLVDECERDGSVLPALTHFGCGGAPVPAALVERADAVGIRVLRLYGSMEVLCATWNRPDSPVEKRCHTDGPALSHTDLRIEDGELHVRGPHTSVGFFEDAERTAATYLPGGWVRSGDLVEMDSEGYVTVVGRKKEILIRGGINVAPREIEELIVAFPEVRQAAVVGVPDARLGERMCACVVLRDGASLDLTMMTARLRARGLATYKLPEQIQVVDQLPATASGKVQKHELLKRILAERS